MGQVTIILAAFVVTGLCQTQTNVDSSVSHGFMPINNNQPSTVAVVAPETSSVQSRDYSGGSDFYGYNGYPASYGPPSSSYGSSGSGVSFEPSSPGESSSYSGSSYSVPYYPSYGEDTKKRKPSYAAPYYPPTTVACPSPLTNNILTDILKTGSTAKFGLIKSVIAAIVTLFLAKIPILLAVKALILKLFVAPIAIVVLSLPILVPAALLFQPLWKRWKEFVGLDSKPQMVMMMPSNDTNSTTTPAKTRALENNLESVLSNLLESEKCMERLACQLGVRDSKAEFKQQVSWVLKFLQSLRVVQNNPQIRDKLKQYREAYIYGIESGQGIGDEENMVNSVCSEVRYPCRSTQRSLQRSTRMLVDFAGY
ncbi:uncharacterized protein LOC126893560 [Daktulosphaira vitifoliae]|uniref:uncharacterized protein LOC126893560 n=1 Tax=Daktulosphaira vitifoliae TaxID=58002 RepID=UPI0021AAA4D6|nr:uncharacterized protein LOC126893560 [Daktulosphaira vitifoliae]